MHQPFQVLAEDRVTSYVLKAAYDIEPLTGEHAIAIKLHQGEDVVYITKAQAMEFFGLIENPCPNGMN